jgi:hypothetical protein
LTEECQLRQYMPGDVVRMELHVENDGANLDNAFARFVHENNPLFQKTTSRGEHSEVEQFAHPKIVSRARASALRTD